MIIHERYGLVQHTLDLARRLATDGFVVIAPDLFWNHPDQEAVHRGEIGVDLSDTEVLVAAKMFSRASRRSAAQIQAVSE